MLRNWSMMSELLVSRRAEKSTAVWRLRVVFFLTGTRFLAGCSCVYLSALGSLGSYIIPLFSYIFLTDLLDGRLARRWGVSSRLGAIADYAVDRLNFLFVIILLIQKGLAVLLFLPFFLRDLISFVTQLYIGSPKIVGTKSMSVVGTVGCYAYLAVLVMGGRRSLVAEVVLCLALIVSLCNMSLRIVRLRRQVMAAFRQDRCEVRHPLTPTAPTPPRGKADGSCRRG